MRKCHLRFSRREVKRAKSVPIRLSQVSLFEEQKRILTSLHILRSLRMEKRYCSSQEGSTLWQTRWRFIAI